MSNVEQWEHDEQRAMENEIISLREQVEKLTKERDEYRLKYQIKADKSDTYSREASTHEDTIEFATGYALSIANYLHQHFFDDVPQWRPLDDLIGLQTQISNMVTGIGEQIAALAEQNEKLRDALRGVDARTFYDSSVCAMQVNAVAKNALSLPDLATPVLNKYRAEGMREAINLYSPDDSAQDWIEKISARADELEKSQ